MKRVLFTYALIFSIPPAFALRPYRGGVVATQHVMASKAALEMLNKGGNAVDAAVAAAFALSVVGPYHSGIGGGGFALTYNRESAKTRVLDFREVAPAKATREMFIKDGKPDSEQATDGALSVAVPGAAKGYLELLAQEGKLPRKVVLAPAIRLAKNGFWVTPYYQHMARMRLSCLRADPEASRLFLRPNENGAPDVPPLKTLIKQPELAHTLELMAQEGEKGFYAGKVAQNLAASVQAKGGILTPEDLARFHTRRREPLETTYRGYRVQTMPPPSAGGLALVQTLGVLERFGEFKYHDVQSIHRMVETLRRVYVDRVKYLGDPDMVQVPVAKLTSAAYLDQLKASINDQKATASQSLLQANSTDTLPPESVERNTTHISVLDKDGNAASMTSSVNYAFGSCVVAKGTGVLLNDHMDDFAIQPLTANVFGLVTGESNAIAPGKIPLSSMTPTLVFHKDDSKRIMMVVGSPGGSTIPTTVLQVITNVLDHKMDIVRAAGAGRIHHQYLPDFVSVDPYALDPSTAAALEAKGHQLRRVDAWGDAEAVMENENGLRFAGSDTRREGAAMGQY